MALNWGSLATSLETYDKQKKYKDEIARQEKQQQFLNMIQQQSADRQAEQFEWQKERAAKADSRQQFLDTVNAIRTKQTDAANRVGTLLPLIGFDALSQSPQGQQDLRNMGWPTIPFQKPGEQDGWVQARIRSGEIPEQFVSPLTIADIQTAVETGDFSGLPIDAVNEVNTVKSLVNQPEQASTTTTTTLGELGLVPEGVPGLAGLPIPVVNGIPDYTEINKALDTADKIRPSAAKTESGQEWTVKPAKDVIPTEFIQPGKEGYPLKVDKSTGQLLPGQGAELDRIYKAPEQSTIGSANPTRTLFDIYKDNPNILAQGMEKQTVKVDADGNPLPGELKSYYFADPTKTEDPKQAFNQAHDIIQLATDPVKLFMWQERAGADVVNAIIKNATSVIAGGQAQPINISPTPQPTNAIDNNAQGATKLIINYGSAEAALTGLLQMSNDEIGQLEAAGYDYDVIVDYVRRQTKAGGK